MINGYRSIFHRTTLSKHSIRRMRQRANLRNKKGRNRFAKDIIRYGLCLYDIPRHPRFTSFFYYMKHMCKKANNKSPLCKVYLYKNYIVPISIDGVIITCFEVKEDFKQMFDEIVEYKNKLRDPKTNITENILQGFVSLN